MDDASLKLLFGNFWVAIESVIWNLWGMNFLIWKSWVRPSYYFDTIVIFLLLKPLGSQHKIPENNLVLNVIEYWFLMRLMLRLWMLWKAAFSENLLHLDSFIIDLKPLHYKFYSKIKSNPLKLTKFTINCFFNNFLNSSCIYSTANIFIQQQ